MNLIENLSWRYATKRMNGTKISVEKLDNIREAIRMAPTSFGLQAFKVINVEDMDLRKKIYDEACQQPQILEASNLFVFAAYKKVTAELVDEYMQSISKTRGIPFEALAGFKSAFDGVVGGTAEQNFVWTSKQTYIALGVGLVAAANEKVDATPMEGFNPAALDKILDLDAQNLGSVSILALGYRDEVEDKYAQAAKVRKNTEDIFINI